MLCNNCKMQIPDGAKFCGECGAPQPQMNNAANVSFQNPAPNPAPAPAPAPKKNSKIKTVFSAIFACIIIAVIAYSMFGDNGVFAKTGTVTYEAVLEDGTRDVSKWSYKGDVITKLDETIYYIMPEGMTEEEAKLQLKTQFMQYESLEFATVTYNLEGEHFVVRLVFRDLDDESNAWKFGLAGLADVKKFGELISLKKTEASLKNEGYVKK